MITGWQERDRRERSSSSQNMDIKKGNTGKYKGVNKSRKGRGYKTNEKAICHTRREGVGVLVMHCN